jgi:thiamine-phosphate pyrophosphorylase
MAPILNFEKIDMLRYAITDRKQMGGGNLVDAARRWAAAGVDFIQLREKDLADGELEEIARAMVGVLKAAGGRTKLLVNGRLDVAMAAGADGVHLTAAAGELTVEQVRNLWPGAVVSVACHSLEEVARACAAGADLVVFGPVFEKPLGGWGTMPGIGPVLPGPGLVLPGAGLEMLREICGIAGGTPVLALGGMTAGNAADCVAAGAAGVAGIRLFL